MEYSNKIWFKRWWGVLIIIIIAIILFFLAVSASYFVGEIKNAKLKLNQAEPIRQLKESGQKYDAASGDNYWLGSANAKITIVEFGDFACPVCLQSFPTVREISLRYKNDIKLIWRDYPVVSDYSANLALAARCAGEQGLFWPMHDKLFQNQGVGQTDDKIAQFDELAALANQIGANQAKFKDCFDRQKYLPQIQKDLTDGQAFGIAGTPTYFIDGYKLEGDVPLDIFIKMIEQLKK
ncbi:MAG: thioredoxin domain-containing protein [bacterium]|nr:thioredoxin domain-containing protein [bacterium]